jgi:ADP-dependent phosphofructokinase/glucokinase
MILPAGDRLDPAALPAALPALAHACRPVLAGFSACFDHLFDLAAVLPALLAAGDPDANALGRELHRRCALGIGGEIRIQWPDAERWLAPHVAAGPLIGGTAAQAALVLAMLGAPAILALADRSAAQLACLHPLIRLATPDGMIMVAEAAPAGRPKPPHCIFEYAAGVPVADLVPTRSTRVIVRLADDAIEDDPAFHAALPALARQAGAMILSGLNAVPAAELAAAIRLVADSATIAQAAGVPLRHLELCDFPVPDCRGQVLAALGGSITSLGLNLNEFDALAGQAGPLEQRMLAVAEALGLERITVHADPWAASLTRGEPERERLALAVGCLLAATRAATGRPALPAAYPAAARHQAPPACQTALPSGWSFVAWPAPFLAAPASTIGLGDTFLAGSMLVLAQPDGAALPRLADWRCLLAPSAATA